VHTPLRQRDCHGLSPSAPQRERLYVHDQAEATAHYGVFRTLSSSREHVGVEPDRLKTTGTAGTATRSELTQTGEEASYSCVEKLARRRHHNWHPMRPEYPPDKLNLLCAWSLRVREPHPSSGRHIVISSAVEVASRHDEQDIVGHELERDEQCYHAFLALSMQGKAHPFTCEKEGNSRPLSRARTGSEPETATYP